MGVMICSGIASTVVGIGTFVCFIMVLIKLFQREGAGMGILGLICGIYTYIWGWIHARDENLQKIMLIWTVLMVLSIIAGIVMGIASATMDYGSSFSY